MFYQIKRYATMSKRERKNELQSTLWFMPMWYIIASICLSALTFFLDYKLDLAAYFPKLIAFSASTTQTLLGSLVGGVLTLSAFTINSILVALTTFSGQFSSKMLLNYISDRNTQHVMGIFNGSFIYVLLNFLYVSNDDVEYLLAIPFLSIATVFLAAITFVYFINHTTTWLQVHNITSRMKENSKKIIQSSLMKEIEPFRKTTDETLAQKPTEEGNVILAESSGYLQLADFQKLIYQAKEDDLVISLQPRIGEFVLCNTPLFTYWGDEEKFNKKTYLKLVELGKKQTEIQDLEYGVNKLAEVAIRALGNDDPLTVTNTLHQITELLQEVGSVTDFSPYLYDKDGHLRLMLCQEDFKFYLHKGFANIREYSHHNVTIITEILSMLSLLAKGMDERFLPDIWEFAYQTVKGLNGCSLFENDCYYLINNLESVSRNTHKENEFDPLKEELLKTIYQ
ncbi:MULTISPECIES: DUF2254 domain-containing protein [Pontibacillus]|uniref:DUF2254 domain-containing protein n=1 Tax=Pontibacillus chungwhensis TaxID=265426 RepID=A0ABY8UT68_9BACI|nr:MULTISPECIES: DUF2254 domain-containing protein [Pontibacillus]MCD5323114.1 DUF2254 domain-containing protein [Pontibacillus sp. HN14]WIF96503.1 DUF2254 domain-containing protein [Pontibacillus chungwhensis]